jgi:hypothetical protein
MAVNEKTGTIVQVSEIGFTGMLNVAQKSMKLPGISLRVQKLNQTLVPGTWVQALQGSGA